VKPLVGCEEGVAHIGQGFERFVQLLQLQQLVIVCRQGNLSGCITFEEREYFYEI